MKKILQRIPFFLVLLPVFFVLHGCLENYGFVDVSDALKLTVIYCIYTGIIYCGSYLFYTNAHKAALLTACLMSFYFFFGAVRDFLKQYVWVLHKYSVLLTLFLIALIILVIYLKRTTATFYKTVLFLNLLMGLYVLGDIAITVWKTIHFTGNHTGYALTEAPYTRCDTCTRPDIYFLLFDEYASSLSLQEQYNYNNSDLDSFLLKEGFRVQKRSQSNYNITPFSMESILNMSYLKHIKNPAACTVIDYAACNQPIKEGEVLKFLSIQGYEIINYSIFNLAGTPSPADQDFLPLKTTLITKRTLFYNIKKDLGWLAVTYLPGWITGRNDLMYLANNNKLIDLVKRESSKAALKPRFIYAHLFMPHPPFFYDRDGKMLNPPIPYSRTRLYIKSYLDYLPYTNSKVKELIRTIQQNSERRAVIIFMGDHGFRPNPADSSLFNFENQNAVYFPDNDYRMLYDSISGVNQFRVVLNKLFKQEFPVLKDSTIFLQDKK